MYLFVVHLNLDKLATMPSKVPPNYFIYPELRAIIGFPIVWGLLPIAGFQPDLLASYLPPDIFQSILKAQVYVTDLYSKSKIGQFVTILYITE